MTQLIWPVSVWISRPVDHIPEADRVVHAGRCELGSIGAEGQRQERARLFLHRQDNLAGREVPDSHVPIGTG